MKKLLIYGLAALTALTFASCEKDNSGDDPQPPQFKKLVKVITRNCNGHISQSVFRYDEQNRVISLATKFPQEINSDLEHRFSYESNNVMESSSWSKDEMLLGKNRIVKFVSTSTSPKYVFTTEYKYSSDNYLTDILASTTNSSSSNSPNGNESLKLSWENGNLVKIGGSAMGSDAYGDTYKYGSKPNLVNFQIGEYVFLTPLHDMNLWSIGIGKLCANLLEEIVYKSGYSNIGKQGKYTYTYELDSDGCPTKVTEVFVEADGTTSPYYTNIYTITY